MRIPTLFSVLISHFLTVHGATITFNGPAANQIQSLPTTSTAPIFSQSSFAFSANGCSAGTYVGIVTATTPGGATPTTYSTDNPSFATVNAQTGQITLGPSVTGTANFNVLASNSIATAIAPVTVTTICASQYNAYNPYTAYNPYSTVYNPYNTATAYNPYSTVYNPSNTVYNPYSTYNPYATTANMVCSNGACYNPATTTLNNPSSGVSTFSTTDCAAGTFVGSVAAPGSIAYSYQINGNQQFYITPAGLIYVTSVLAPGTYNFSVSTQGATGTTVTSVTVIVNCLNYYG